MVTVKKIVDSQPHVSKTKLVETSSCFKSQHPEGLSFKNQWFLKVQTVEATNTL